MNSRDTLPGLHAITPSGGRTAPQDGLHDGRSQDVEFQQLGEVGFLVVSPGGLV
ncbi:MAG: hypothetical protein H7833_16290 [Magnetococcus sp. DMHC-1]|nr:hypothetical protein [Magnetococcales bacterium]